MAPRKGLTEEEPTIADLFKLMKGPSDQLTSITSKITRMEADLKKMETIESEMQNIKTLVVSLRDENKELKSALKQKDEQLCEMQAAMNSLEIKMNNVEQHHRGWGARVLNIPTTEEEEADPSAMIHKVFDLALKPVLEGAVRLGKLRTVPEPEQVLEVAHVLPGKPGQPKPIIMRFFNRNTRNLIFSLKKDFAVREQDGRPRNGGGGGASGGRVDGEQSGQRVGRYKYPLYDDLTKPNINKMRAIAQDDRVLACWTVNGQIRYRLKNDDKVRKLVSILDPLDEILNK